MSLLIWSCLCVTFVALVLDIAAGSSDDDPSILVLPILSLSFPDLRNCHPSQLLTVVERKAWGHLPTVILGPPAAGRFPLLSFIRPRKAVPVACRLS